MTGGRFAAALLFACGAFPQVAPAQDTLDERLLLRVHGAESLGPAMRFADAAALPGFGAGAVALAVGAARGDAAFSDVYRLAVAEAAAGLLAFGLKSVLKRPRPFAVLDDVQRRGHVARWDPYAFPSVHAAVAFGLATSWTLSHPHAAPVTLGYVWAAGVAASRVWLGVHWPSDVLAGAALGAAVALAVHAFAPDP